MAIQAQVSLVPIAISGAYELVPTGFKMRPGTVDVAIGDPIPTTNLSSDDLISLMEKSWNDLNGLKEVMDNQREALSIA